MKPPPQKQQSMMIIIIIQINQPPPNPAPAKPIVIPPLHSWIVELINIAYV